MSKKIYRCLDCEKFFNNAVASREYHSRDDFAEVVALCPHCSSSNFEVFKPEVPKIDIAERLLLSVKELHILKNSIKGVFGGNFENRALEEATGNLTELFFELFPFTDSRTDMAVLSVTTDREISAIMEKIGGLQV